MTDPTRAEQVAHDLIYNKLWNKEHNSWVKVSDAVQIIATALRAEGDRVCREGAERVQNLSILTMSCCKHTQDFQDKAVAALLASRNLT